MSKYEDQYDNENAVCPYCGNKSHVEGEDYSEDTREVYCEECGKNYWMSQSFTVTHCTSPDCKLNGRDCQYEESECHHGSDFMFCIICGGIKRISKS